MVGRTGHVGWGWGFLPERVWSGGLGGSQGRVLTVWAAAGWRVGPGEPGWAGTPRAGSAAHLDQVVLKEQVGQNMREEKLSSVQKGLPCHGVG